MKGTIILSIYFLFSFSFCKAQWYQQDPDIHAIFCIDFLDENTGISGGITRSGNVYWGKALYTTNSGQNWNNASYPDSSRDFASCIFINDNLCYMGGDYYDSSQGVPYLKPFIVQSTDQGKNWSPLCTFPSQYNWFLDMDFVNANTGYASVQIFNSSYVPIAYMLKTTDAGKTWITQLTLDSLSDLYKIDCINENVVIGVGGNGNSELDYTGIVVKTVNGGLDWERRSFNELIVVDDVFFTDDDNGYITGRGDYGYIYRTTNQGVDWIRADSINNIIQFIHVDFCKRTGIGLLYGHQQPGVGPFVWKTTDYGITWSDQNVSFPFSQALIVGDMVDSVNYFLGATTPPNISAKIFSTTNGGSVFVNNPGNIIPSNIRLYQNYPNPFNPKTTIEYTIPYSQLVTIKVFDILGNEVSVLYNGKQSPGTYSVVWDAAGNPSGIYFYILTAGKFSETKKMMVIK